MDSIFLMFKHWLYYEMHFDMLIDCGTPIQEPGYIIGTVTDNSLHDTVSVDCDTPKYVGPSFEITCGTSGWSPLSGCIAGMSSYRYIHIFAI